MTLSLYAGYATITVISVILIMRAFYFAMIQKSDPIKAIVPRMPKFPKNKQELVDESKGAS